MDQATATRPRPGRRFSFKLAGKAAVRNVATVALFLVAFDSFASAQVVVTPQGQVEFIGLKRWTVQMIRDSMAVHAPGKPLGQCAVVLRNLGFPSADAREVRIAGEPALTVVTLVEPEDSARVRPRPAPADSVADLPQWAPATRIFRGDNYAFQVALNLRGFRQDSISQAAEISRRRANESNVRVLWRFLDAHRSQRDLEHALRTLRSDANLANSAVALAILGNFGERDAVWWRLLDVARDVRPGIAATAEQVLTRLVVTNPRRVDWAPAVPTLRSLLRGTNVFELTSVFGVLTTTKISPRLAPVLLRDGGGDLALAYMSARYPRGRDLARRFLIQLAGRDLGDDADVWASWIASFH